MAEFFIETDRLILREWRDDDALPLHKICNDEQVMAFIGPVQSKEEIEAAIVKQRQFQAELGYCYWAIEHRESQSLIGFCGLMPMPEAVPFAPQIDIGWRLSANEWGKGFAKEAASACLSWGFGALNCPSIWAITVWNNSRSSVLMERLGMSRHFDLDFDHPSVPDDSSLKPHITYSISRKEWLTRR